jgi:hypothetical protein
MQISNNQFKYGVEKLNNLAKQYSITPGKMAELLLSIGKLNDFHNWVNADQFLNEYVHQGDRLLTTSLNA